MLTCVVDDTGYSINYTVLYLNKLKLKELEKSYKFTICILTGKSCSKNNLLDFSHYYLKLQRRVNFF